MADDKSKRDFLDRHRVAGDEVFEVEYFAAAAGISSEQARELIRKHGDDDREMLMREAKKLRGT